MSAYYKIYWYNDDDDVEDDKIIFIKDSNMPLRAGFRICWSQGSTCGVGPTSGF